MAEILAQTSDSLKKARTLLDAGDVVAIPTETVYGLAARLDRPTALEKVFSVKERPKFDPLILHFPPPTQTESFTDVLRRHHVLNENELSTEQLVLIETLFREFSPGPLTQVLPKSETISDLISGGLPTVGVRFPIHPLAQALLKEVGCALAAPSANRFGRISPTSASAVHEELGDRISLILDGGQSQVGIESTVIRVNKDLSIDLLRPGTVTEDQIRVALRKLQFKDIRYLLKDEDHASPGRSLKHYAPSKPFFALADAPGETLEKISQTFPKSRGVALLLSQSLSTEIKKALLESSSTLEIELKVTYFSYEFSYSEIANTLFRILRESDASDCAWIVCEMPNDRTGLAFAIYDRLSRAITKS